MQPGRGVRASKALERFLPLLDNPLSAQAFMNTIF